MMHTVSVIATFAKKLSIAFLNVSIVKSSFLTNLINQFQKKQPADGVTLFSTSFPV